MENQRFGAVLLIVIFHCHVGLLKGTYMLPTSMDTPQVCWLKKNLPREFCQKPHGCDTKENYCNTNHTPEPAGDGPDLMVCKHEIIPRSCWAKEAIDIQDLIWSNVASILTSWKRCQEPIAKPINAVEAVVMVVGGFGGSHLPSINFLPGPPSQGHSTEGIMNGQLDIMILSIRG